jgi:hypothetical protein
MMQGGVLLFARCHACPLRRRLLAGDARKSKIGACAPRLMPPKPRVTIPATAGRSAELSSTLLWWSRPKNSFSRSPLMSVAGATPRARREYKFTNVRYYRSVTNYLKIMATATSESQACKWGMSNEHRHRRTLSIRLPGRLAVALQRAAIKESDNTFAVARRAR